MPAPPPELLLQLQMGPSWLSLSLPGVASPKNVLTCSAVNPVSHGPASRTVAAKGVSTFGAPSCGSGLAGLLAVDGAGLADPRSPVQPASSSPQTAIVAT